MAAPLLSSDPFSRSQLPLSDAGNATRLILLHSDRLRYVPTAGWRIWEGTHWAWKAAETELQVQEAALDTLAAMDDEIAALEMAIKALDTKGELGDAEKNATKCVALQKRAVALRKWKESAESGSHPKRMCDLAAGKLRARREDFDAPKPGEYVINTPNATLHLRRKIGDVWDIEPEAHLAAELLTKITRTEWNADADDTPWQTHLKRIMPDAEERAFLARLVGYSALGAPVRQLFVLLQGRGGDGKSVTLNVIRRVLGDYADKGPSSLILDTGQSRDANGPTPALAALAGDLRLLHLQEVKRGSRLDESLVKEITGGSAIVCRDLNKPPFSFSPRFVIWGECNELPNIKGPDRGIWRRVRVFPFRVSLPEADQDAGLEERLIKECAPGVLRWIVNGAIDYLERDGLEPPASITRETEQYRLASNEIIGWLSERTERVADHVETVAALYTDYADYCETAGAEPISKPSFGKALNAEQIAERRSSKARQRIGLKLLPTGMLAGVNDN
ncbi:MAG: phage/plasmid primase, P4 family [Vitreimonas sp.]